MADHLPVPDSHEAEGVDTRPIDNKLLPEVKNENKEPSFELANEEAGGDSGETIADPTAEVLKDPEKENDERKPDPTA